MTAGSQLREQLLAPAARADVEEERARGVGDIAAMSSGEAVAHVVLGQGDLADASVGAGSISRIQSSLGGEARQARFPVSLTRRSRPPRLERGTLWRGALVVPEDRRTDDLAGRVETDQPMHLAGETDAEDLRHVDLQAVEHQLCCRQPLLRCCSIQPGGES